MNGLYIYTEYDWEELTAIIDIEEIDENDWALGHDLKELKKGESSIFYSDLPWGATEETITRIN